MNKFTILFLTLLLALPVAMNAESAKEKETTPDTLQEPFLKLMVRSYFPKNFKFRE